MLAIMGSYRYIVNVAYSNLRPTTASIALLALLRMQQHTNHAGIVSELDAQFPVERTMYEWAFQIATILLRFRESRCDWPWLELHIRVPVRGGSVPGGLWGNRQGRFARLGTSGRPLWPKSCRCA